MLQEENQKLERKIADVQDQNSKLSDMLKASVIVDGEKLRKERHDALVMVEEERKMTKFITKKYKNEITRMIKKRETEKSQAQKEISFWRITSIVLAVVILIFFFW
ncbi:MAG: hypothetical protein PUF29_05120 [Anaerobutyricum hallii]|uniref:hypothetical protein n=1 Tax=Anaerobutyricum hallii TaxID=39488 RepID=UPI00242FDCB5|nr:hypothetical protein [Anaerobutyricum hallii]MDD6587989.1 hypothetical protein [Anaerobutyricum hallii]